MGPTVPQQQPTGNSTTWYGIFSLIAAGLSAFTQIWTTIHGAPVDPLHTTTTIGMAASGVGLIKAQDAAKK